MYKKRIYIVVLCLLPGLFFWIRTLNKPPLAPLEVSMWYWHRPYFVTKEQQSLLKQMGVTEMFVNAATLKQDGAQFVVTLGQIWKENSSDIPVHLVFRFHPRVVSDFATIPEVQFIESVASVTAAEADRAERAGVKVKGIQIDFDSPTSRLSKYARCLSGIRSRLKTKGLGLSVTVLTTWLPDRQMNDLANSVDFFVPQFYEAVTPKLLTDFRTIFSPDRLKRGLNTSGRVNGTFYAGLPSYGHNLVYDDHGKLLGLYRDTNPDETLRDHRFKLLSNQPCDVKGKPAEKTKWAGESVADFEAPSVSDGEHRSLLRFDIPNPEMIVSGMQLVRENRPRNCRGVILFRFPEPDERSTVPLTSVSAAIQGIPLKPDLKISSSVASAPWNVIERSESAKRPQQELKLFVTNIGNASTSFREDSLVLRIRLNMPGLGTVRERLFNGKIEAKVMRTDLPFQMEKVPDSSLSPCSSQNGNLIELKVSSLHPGERLVIGPLVIPADGATQFRGEWKMSTNGGYETISGSIPLTNIESGERAKK